MSRPTASPRRLLRRPTLGTLLGAAALVLALGGWSLVSGVAADAASLINGSKLRNGTVTGSKLKDGSISTTKLAPTALAALRGAAGPAGAAGAAGERGAAGAQGPKGEKGDKGDAGPQGAPGTAAAKGDTGATGAAGPQGATGATGPQGAKGDTGPQGPAGQDASTADGSVTSAKLADGAVTSAKVSGPIATGKLTNLAVTQAVALPAVPVNACAYSAQVVLGSSYNLKYAALIATPRYDTTLFNAVYTPEVTGEGALKMKICNEGSSALQAQSVFFNFVAFQAG